MVKFDHIRKKNNRSTGATPLELLIRNVVKSLGLVVANNENDDSVINIDEIRRLSVMENVQNVANYDKFRFDRSKALMIKYKVVDNVLFKNEEIHQTKIDLKFRGPSLVTEVSDGDRYTLKSLSSSMRMRIYGKCQKHEQCSSIK